MNFLFNGATSYYRHPHVIKPGYISLRQIIARESSSDVLSVATQFGDHLSTVSVSVTVNK